MTLTINPELGVPLDKEEPKRAFNERVEDRVRDVVERKILSKIPKVISKL